jgi:response regulator RpfG family c-di-GMP phosphodiesterase
MNGRADDRAGTGRPKGGNMAQTRKMILVVDESADRLFFTRKVLGEQGYEVLTHQSPFGVTGLIQASKPDLVLLGTELRAFPAVDLAANLCADSRTRHVPVVLCSPRDDAAVRSKVAKYRLSGYICTENATELRMKVSYFLNEHNENPSLYRQRLYAVE